MTKEREMPDEVYIWGCPRSIGDMGFTVTKPKDNHVKYIRADLSAPAVDAEDLKKETYIFDGKHTSAPNILADIDDKAQGWNDCLDHIAKNYNLTKK